MAKNLRGIQHYYSVVSCENKKFVLKCPSSKFDCLYKYAINELAKERFLKQLLGGNKRASFLRASLGGHIVDTT